MSIITESQPVAPAVEPLTPLGARNRELLHYRDGAMHLAYRITCHRDDAEDVLQEAFLRAVRTTSPILSGLELRNWFLQIVANAARDYVRSEQARRNRERTLSMEKTAFIPPSQPLEKAELRERVEAELAQLNEKVRVPLALHYEHGLTFEEASSVLGIPAGTLRVQASRGLDELRARLCAAGKPVSAEILVGVLAATVLLRPAPAAAAVVDAIVAAGPKGGTLPQAPGMKVFTPRQGFGVPFALKALAITALIGLLGFAGSVVLYMRQAALAQPSKASVGGLPAQSIGAPSATLSSPNVDSPPAAPETPAALPAAKVAAPRDYVPPLEFEAQWNGAAELLPHVNPARDSIVSQWAFDGTNLVVEPYKFSKLALPYHPPEEYDYRVDFTRLRGNAEVDVVFPVKNRSALLSVGAWGKFYFGGDPKSPDAVQNVSLKSLTRHTVVVEVRKKTLTAWFDGKLMKTVDVDKANYLSNPHWRMPDQTMPGLGAWDSCVSFHRVAIRELSGPGESKESDADLDRINDAAHWEGAVNLLQSPEVRHTFVKGNWEIANGALRSPKNAAARVEFGYEPPAEYDFRIDFRRLDGTRDIVQICSAAGHPFCWKISAADFCIVDSINGNSQTNSPAAVIVPDFCVDTLVHVSVVCVRKNGIKAFVDGKLVGCWRTDFSDMGIDVWKLNHVTALGVGAQDSNVIFEKIVVKEITGTGKIIAPAEDANGGF